MKKISLILALIVVAVGAYLLFQATNPYYGLVTEIEVQSDEATVEYLEQQLEQTLAAMEAAYQSGETPDLDMFLIAATNAYYLGDLAQAREIYEEYFDYNSINPASWNTYANILYKMEDWDNAEEAYRTALELSPMEEFYMDLVKVIEKDSERYLEVEELLKEAVEVLGQSRSLMVALASWYEETGDCERSIAHYSVAKTLAESDTLADSVQEDIDRVEETCEQK
ncbi:tetratricopeptide repeat protein [Candidatus Uhrbacteria bacterium]|jgi:tetratricopeptide (TPR) repeat protein|nr:tetratricopeptide repeat protein [Candidatus Uhrbacteria bacterium]MBT7717570.1 tetratricopeptide repeat protein [Candidatus Uhrbacteria bacterium]